MITPSTVSFAARTLGEKPWLTWARRMCFALSFALIACAIWSWGAVEVRGEMEIVLCLSFFDFIWLLFAQSLFPWLGLDVADDVIERRNVAALVGVCGGTLALAIIYAGGNCGEGPSYWNNVFSAGLGTIGLFGLWLFLELAGRVSVSITEERDLASGIRLGGFLIAAGLILGRAVVGDWHSESQTVNDFIHDGWPVGAICVVAVWVERIVRPSRVRPFPGWIECGLLPALIYIGGACAWLGHLGRWEGMP